MATARGEMPKWMLWRKFLYLFFLHALGIYLFTRGFLLTRTELPMYSHCSDLMAADFPCSFLNSTATADKSTQCYTKPAVDRLIIIVLDALRFDFVAPSTFFEDTKPWMDKLKVLQKMASSESFSARIFKAIADPPTTSLQRLKGLTTGGLPTFIDVGNSFGAPAIVEDNLIHQLARNGKRVLMMGDDTWLQLFPEYFDKSYPYPSFNVKDLDTVDNGVIEHLLPSLYKDDWDVLIAHFLGVDHAGHIFGVESQPMTQKLEQYNAILDDVIGVLKNISASGVNNENTLLIVMGDHGQTLNGDHGGGTPEEVETSLFAWSVKSPSTSVSSIFDGSMCKLDLDGHEMCISTMQQLDFAATMAALLGVPFPYGSIGRVNPELYALCSGTWENQRMLMRTCQYSSDLEEWMRNYAQVLCVNSWQVKRYIDIYAETSVIGLPKEDLLDAAQLYNHAQANWSYTWKRSCHSDNISDQIDDSSVSILQQQIDAYSNFLENVIHFARSAWTEFDISLMVVGLVVMVMSIVVHYLSIRRVNSYLQHDQHKPEVSADSFRTAFALCLVAVRAASFLSNSFILTEGTVANFLLATTSVINVWLSLSKGKFNFDDILFLLLNIFIRFGIESGMAKQTSSATDLEPPLSFLGFDNFIYIWAVLMEILAVIILVWFLSIVVKSMLTSHSCYYFKCGVVTSSIVSFMGLTTYWFSESDFGSRVIDMREIGKRFSPRVVYVAGISLHVLCAFHRIFSLNSSTNISGCLRDLTVGLLASWSPTILILSGKQSPIVALACVTGVWCITRPQSRLLEEKRSETAGKSRVSIMSVIQWNLLAVCLFYHTGHWCTFDGLRYGAAFIGFEHFNIVRQGILLSVDTFGFSHILPILSLPFLTILSSSKGIKRKHSDRSSVKLTLVFLTYGLITATTTLFTIICVTIQRRHLMVWGLFAPKYVFDAIGLLLTDALICLASLYYL